MPVLERLFTVEEANRTLVRIRPLLEEVVRLRRRSEGLVRQLHRLHREIHSEVRPPAADLRERLEDRLARLSAADERISELSDRLRAEGVVLKDPRRGLVDFPAVLDRQPVYLCYLLGEEEVGWWHGVEEGFQGRRRLSPRQEREETDAL